MAEPGKAPFLRDTQGGLLREGCEGEVGAFLPSSGVGVLHDGKVWVAVSL